MARFRWEDDTLIADEDGNLDYHGAVSSLIEQAVAEVEELLWNLADDFEYVVGEEQDEPSNEDDNEEDE